MRELKFRAWDKNECKMAEVTQVIFSKVQYTLVKYRYKADSGKVKDETSHIDEKGCGSIVLMQYTGLKDKNGKEIYEGDIVEYFKDYAVIKMIPGGFIIENEHFKDYMLEIAGEIKVIGNIYKNKELLEEK